MEDKNNQHTNNQKNSMSNDLKDHIDGAMGTLNDIKSTGRFDIKKEFMNAIEILKLNEKKMKEIATRKTTASVALLFILAGVVASGLGMHFMFSSWLRPSLTYTLISMAFSFLMTIVGIFALDFVANALFKGKGNFGQLFRVLGYSSILMIPYIVLPILPGLIGILSPILGIWGIVVLFKAMGVIKKLNAVNIILTLVIVAVAFSIIMALLSSLFGYGYGMGFGTAPYGEVDNVGDAIDALRDLGY